MIDIAFVKKERKRTKIKKPMKFCTKVSKLTLKKKGYIYKLSQNYRLPIKVHQPICLLNHWPNKVRTTDVF
jgi:hypothetical protein